MFLLLLKYIAPIEKIDKILEDHVKFLDKYYSLQKFICSGRMNPRTGGVILCNVKDLNEINEVIKEDPFSMNNVVEYEIVEFSPTKYLKGFEPLLQNKNCDRYQYST